jgi:DNA adenine methylase
MATPVAKIGLQKRAVPLRAPSPFVKWVGGKGRILTQLMPLLPAGAERMRHVEPFAGGAAMFFARRPERALICDVNAALVRTYLAVRDHVEDVIDRLEHHAARHDRAHYYRVRDDYNAAGGSGVERAAMFIYLNKTCFNGLHRVNRRGEFNVPAGRYTKPNIADVDGLRAASHALRHADVRNERFEGLLKLARPGDFVYLDPPYEPVSRTASFTSYAQDGFTQDDQARLRDVFAELTRRGCRCMLSNSDVPFIRTLYREFRIDTVAAPRAVSCDATRRGPVSEVVVRNY